MTNLSIKNDLDAIKKTSLIYDIECSSHYLDGRPIDIKSDFDNYVKNAKVKWVGMYSFKDNKGYCLDIRTNFNRIFEIINTHDVLVGFNSEAFDFPILINNQLIDTQKKYIHIDLMQILGTSNQRNKDGYKFKNRAELQDIKLKNNSLRGMAEGFKLEVAKGDIDYKLFYKDEWTPEETEEIKKYLKVDILITKQLFEKTWDYWLPFAELLDQKNIYNLSWLKSSIASLTYKAACHVLDTEPTYSDKVSEKEEVGGNVILPKLEEAEGVWYLDFASLYPHMFTCFNLPAELKEEEAQNNPYAWHGNEVFKVRGYYDSSTWHPLSKYIAEKLKERIYLKESDPKNPLVYTLKILCNCFSADTKIVMADNTIKDIKDCKIGELVWSINPDTLYAEKKEIIKTFEYNYSGEIHYYEGNYFNFKVTPNHRFLVHKVNNDKCTIAKQEFLESQQITTNYKLPIHKNKKKNNKKIINILEYFPKEYFLYAIKSKSKHGRVWLNFYNLTDKYLDYNCNDIHFIFDYNGIKDVYNKLFNDKDLDIYVFKNGRRREHKKQIYYDNSALSYLVGIYLAEGCTSKINKKEYENGHLRGNIYSIQLAQYKDVNPIIYTKIQNALDKCNLKYSAGRTGFKVSGSIFYDFLINNFGKLDYKCFINKELFGILNLNKVWEGLIDGDGSKKSHLYTTKYDCLKNDFIELCMRLGYTFVIKNDGCWRITYNKSRNVFRPTYRTIEKYNGKVYCIEVKDNNTLLGGRNGYFNWSGNSLYGVMRSAIFEKVHTPNCGADCCALGQQMQKIVVDMMGEFGFETLMGDTDSIFCMTKDHEKNNREFVISCLNKIVDKIKNNMPFPVDTFKISIEKYIDYLMVPFEEQPIIDLETGKNKKEGNRLVLERKGKKKNYLFIYDDKGTKKVKLVGLPIKKDNATALGMRIYEEVLEPLIIERNNAKFEASFIQETINNYLKRPEIMELIAQEYKVNAYSTYKTESIQAQISKAYFDGQEGVIKLVKNSKIGKCGKGSLYCTIQEAIDAKLTAEELDLEKVNQELSPFIKFNKVKEDYKKMIETSGFEKGLIVEEPKKRGRPRKDGKK